MGNTHVCHDAAAKLMGILRSEIVALAILLPFNLGVVVAVPSELIIEIFHLLRDLDIHTHVLYVWKF